MAKFKRLYISIWNKCNLRCDHCFNEGGKGTDRVFSDSEILRVVNEAQEYIGIEEVQLTGGEPTQRPELFSIVKALNRNGLKVWLQTNGIFELETVEEIFKVPSKSLGLIVSLDGIETNDYFRGPGTTKKVIKNINILSSSYTIRLNILLTSLITWGEVEIISELAKKNHLFLAFNPIIPLGRADASLLMPRNKYFEWMQRLEDLRNNNVKLKKNFIIQNGHLQEAGKCPARDRAAIGIAADGRTYYPCGFLANHPEFFLGSVREFSFAELLDNIPSHCQEISVICRECEFYRKGCCFCGCPARIYAMNKRFDAVDIYCMAKYYQEEPHG